VKPVAGGLGFSAILGSRTILASRANINDSKSIETSSASYVLRGESNGRGAMGFKMNTEHDITLIEVVGQLIVSNRQELKRQVTEQIDGGQRKFIIDFSKTAYIDSSGLGVLVSLSKSIGDKKGRLELAGLNEDLRTLFSLTKLDTLFKIRNSREEALRAIATP
jgi:anti-sigma B factor antagonist